MVEKYIISSHKYKFCAIQYKLYMHVILIWNQRYIKHNWAVQHRGDELPQPSLFSNGAQIRDAE